MELKNVKGVGKATLEQLNNEGITTIDELLFTYPNSFSASFSAEAMVTSIS